MKDKKDKTTAVLLAFFFGGLGVHRFYLGKVKSGFLMLLTLGCFGIWSFIDFIVLLCMSSDSFDKKYNS